MIRPLFRNLKDSFVEGLEHTIQDVINLRLGLLVGYLLVVVGIALCCWYPFLLHLHRDDTKSRKLVAILPLDAIRSMRRIHKYIEVNDG